MAQPRTYSAKASLVSPTASATLPVVQLNLPSARDIEIYRIEVTQETSTSTGQTALELVSSTTTAPGTLAGNVTPIALNPSDPASALTLYTSGFSGSLTGTQTSYRRWGFNILNGQLYLPVPEEREIMLATQFLWLRMPVTVPAATYNLTVVYREL